MTYYPTQSLVVGMTVIRRDRQLPPGVYGKVLVRQGAPVQPDTVVLQGSQPGDFVIIDALKALNITLKDGGTLTEDLLQVRPGETLDKEQPIMIIGSGRRTRTLGSPVHAVFVRLEGSQIILRRDPVDLQIKALTPGHVSAIKGNECVTIETVGALIQGAWGNGKETYATLTLEPEGGIEALANTDDPMQRVSGTAMILNKPINDLNVFRFAEKLELGALIAPSMTSGLREIARRQKIPILIVEGFGDLPMSEIVYNLLRGNANRPAAIDAHEPGRWSAERPEITVPLSTTAKPPAPDVNLPLMEGSLVRITRQPNMGVTGRVYRLIDVPRPVENGLLVTGAEIRTANGQVYFAPLANLELLGRPPEAPGRG